MTFDRLLCVALCFHCLPLSTSTLFHCCVIDYLNRGEYFTYGAFLKSINNRCRSIYFKFKFIYSFRNAIHAQILNEYMYHTRCSSTCIARYMACENIYNYVNYNMVHTFQRLQYIIFFLSSNYVGKMSHFAFISCKQLLVVIFVYKNII